MATRRPATSSRRRLNTVTVAVLQAIADQGVAAERSGSSERGPVGVTPVPVVVVATSTVRALIADPDVARRAWSATLPLALRTQCRSGRSAGVLGNVNAATWRPSEDGRPVPFQHGPTDDTSASTGSRWLVLQLQIAADADHSGRLAPVTLPRVRGLIGIGAG